MKINNDTLAVHLTTNGYPWKSRCLTFGLILFLTSAMGQIDTLPVEKPELIIEIDSSAMEASAAEKEVWQPDPKKSLWFSLALPGLGQIYNHSWWKTPLIYGGLGVSIWFIGDNNQNYKDFRQAYSDSFDPNTTNPLVLKYPNQESLRRIRDVYYKRYQLSIIATAAIYLMNGVEAYVDAHLKNFEISDDLSLQWGSSDLQGTLSGMNAASPRVMTVVGVRYRLQ